MPRHAQMRIVHNKNFERYAVNPLMVKSKRPETKMDKKIDGK